MANLRIWMAAPLIAAGAWAAGPQAAATHPRPAAAVTPKRVTVQPKLSDAQLETVIRAKFAKSKINADGFTVRVQGRSATPPGRRRRGTCRKAAGGCKSSAVTPVAP